MRTAQNIYDQMVSEAQNEAELQNVVFAPSSMSKALFWAIASVLYIHELYWSLFKKEVVELLDNQKVHTLKWYENLAKSFQFAHDLIWLNDQFQYEIIDNESKIIKHCAVVHVDNKLRFKIATKGSNGETLACNQIQIDSLSSYLHETKDAGVYIFVTSGSGDLIKISVDVYFDPLVLSSLGELLINNQSIVKDEIEKWIENINFNGRFIVPKFQDMIESIEGVNFAVINSIEVALPSQTVYTVLNNPIYVPDSGYFQLQNLNINYIADV